MKIFKFGGASVKDAEGVKNVATVITKCDEKNLVIVISAMGKMTNALEKVVDSYFKSPETLELAIDEVLQFHINLSVDIFENKQHPIFNDIKELLDGLRGFLKTNKSTNHAFVYDQVVGHGEMLSTLIVSTFLNEQNISNTLLDVRECIVTDDAFRDANVDWQASQAKILAAVSKTGITITQGFLGTEAKNNFTTTLGREGSDYTAAIFAYCLNADSVTIWKDVPGVLNADPRYFSTTTLLHHISYREAIELAFYGASVIHPKTLQPLQRKEIPLYVKSFYEPENAGTCVGKGTTLDPAVSCFIIIIRF